MCILTRVNSLLWPCLIDITFMQGAKILQASHFDYEYVLGHKIAFLCMAKGNPRPHITWLKDGSEIFQHMYMHVSIAIPSVATRPLQYSCIF